MSALHQPWDQKPAAVSLRALAREIAEAEGCDLGTAQLRAEKIIARGQAAQREAQRRPAGAPGPVISLRDLAHRIAREEGIPLGLAQLRAETIANVQRARQAR